MLKLKEARKARKMSQSVVANELGVAQNTYSQYESGLREPSYETLIILSNTFEVSIDYLIGNNLQTYDEAHFDWYMNNINMRRSSLDDLEKAITVAKKEDQQKLIDMYSELVSEDKRDNYASYELRKLGKFLGIFEVKAILAFVKILFPDAYEAYIKSVKDSKDIKSISGFDYTKNKFYDINSALDFLVEHDCLNFNPYQDDGNLIDEAYIFNHAFELKNRIDNNQPFDDLKNNSGVDYTQLHMMDWANKQTEKISVAINEGLNAYEKERERIDALNKSIDEKWEKTRQIFEENQKNNENEK